MYSRLPLALPPPSLSSLSAILSPPPPFFPQLRPSFPGFATPHLAPFSSSSWPSRALSLALFLFVFHDNSTNSIKVRSLYFVPIGLCKLKARILKQVPNNLNEGNLHPDFLLKNHKMNMQIDATMTSHFPTRKNSSILCWNQWNASIISEKRCIWTLTAECHQWRVVKYLLCMGGKLEAEMSHTGKVALTLCIHSI